MAIEEKKIQLKTQTQKVCIENRESATVSGVRDVESFSDTVVNLDTSLGKMIIKGEQLHISKLSVDTGELHVSGKINSCEYSKASRRDKGGFLENLFK